MFLTPGISIDHGETWCYSWEELNNALDVICFDDNDRVMYLDTIIEFMDEDDRNVCEAKSCIDNPEEFFGVFFEESKNSVIIG